MQAAHDQLRGSDVLTPEVKKKEVSVERTVAKDALKFGFLVWLIVRVLLSLWGALIMAVAPPDSHAHVLRDYPGVTLPSHDFYGYTVGVWNIYDTRHYIAVAEQGYEADPDWLPAFFPGYPLMIKAVSYLLVGDSLLAALLIANVSAIIFFWYLYRLIEPDYGEAVAQRAVVLSAVFPASFFLFMGYTEAPLLAFTVMALYYARAQKWWLSGLLATGAALIKQPGIFLLAPLAYMFWSQYRENKSNGSLRQKLAWGWLLLSPLAAFSYSLYRDLYISPSSGGAEGLLWFSQSSSTGSQSLTFPGLPFLHALNAIRPDNPLLAFNLMDIGFTLLMVALVVGVALKVRHTSYLLYSLIICLMNLCISMWTYEYRPEANMPRRMMIIFPIFIFLAVMLSNRRHYRMITYVSSALFLCLSGLFINWIFVS